MAGWKNPIDNIPDWFLLNGSVLALDIVSHLIDSLYFKALAEAPQDILNPGDAKALKIPVLVFIVFVCILQLINISFSIKYRKEIEYLKNLPVIVSLVVVWIDFAQIVIALSTAFRTHQLIGNVQFSQPVFAIIKTIFQIPALVYFYFVKAKKYSKLGDDKENCLVNCLKKNTCNFCTFFQDIRNIALAGFILNFCCSVVLLVRVSLNM